MNTILYFHERDTSQVHDEDIKTLGLEYAFENPPKSRQATTGPGEKAGVVFAQLDNASSLMFKPDEQTWHEYPGRPGLWLGWWNDNPPTPEGLEKKMVLAGHPVESINQTWIIPYAKMLTDKGGQLAVSTAPPTAADFDGTKFIFGGVLPQYSRLMEIAETVWDAFSSGSEGDLLDLPAAAMQMVSDCFSVNYRVGPVEVGKLGLILTSGEFIWSVLQCTIDFQTYQAWSKKKAESAGPPTSCGDLVLAADQTG